MLSNRPPQPIKLDEAAFRALVAGKTVAASVFGQRVELILADLGWKAMLDALLNAMNAPADPPPDPPQAREFLPRRRPKNGRPGK